MIRRMTRGAAAFALLSAVATIPVLVATTAPALPGGDQPVGPDVSTSDGAQPSVAPDASADAPAPANNGTPGSGGTLDGGGDGAAGGGGGALPPCKYQVKNNDCAKLCNSAATLCLDPQGEAVCSPPSSVDEGATLTVRVIGFSGCKEDTFALSTATQKSPDHLTGASLQAGSPDGQVVREISVVASTDVTTSAILISFTHGDINTTTSVTINHGRYYVGVGALLALAPNGTRLIAHDTVPGTTDTRLAVRQDWDIRPALALEVFPFGRDRGRICSFCLDHGTRFWDGVWSITRNVVGLELGTEFDFGDPKQHHYLGAALELISGFSVDVGAAWIQGEFLPAGYTAGMLVGPGFTPDIDYMVRPYFGFTLSQDIINTISSFSSAAKGTHLQ